MSVGCLVPNYSMTSISLADVGFTCAFGICSYNWCGFFLLPMMSIFPVGVDFVYVFFFSNVWVAFLSIGFAEVAEKAVHEEDAEVEGIWQQSGSVHSTGIGSAVPKRMMFFKLVCGRVFAS